MKYDLSNTIANEMDKVLNSDENKQLFSSSSMLEKLAFKRVSEEDKITEVEMELDPSLKKTANCKHCECKSSKDDKCDCHCHHESSTKEASNVILESLNSLLKVSEALDNAGFERLAAASALLANKLVVEAKSSKSKKSEKSKKNDKSKSSKEKGKKVDMKERMKKMREMKDSKKDKKKTSKAQAQQPAPVSLKPVHPTTNEAAVIMNNLPENLKGKVHVEVSGHNVKVAPLNAVPVVTQLIQNLQNKNILTSPVPYKIVSSASITKKKF